MDANRTDKIALNIKIQPIAEKVNYVPIDVLAKYFLDINKSFNNFIQIEFLRNVELNSLLKNNPNYLETYLANCRLYIVDSRIGSFESALAPMGGSDDELFPQEIELPNWKVDKFKEYKDDILVNDYNDRRFLEKITNKYDADERDRIFRPIINMLDSYPNYQVIIERENNPRIFRLMPVEKQLRPVYIPKREKTVNKKKYILACLEVNSDAKPDKLRAKDLNKIIYSEELDHMTYPYKINKIEFDDLSFELNHEISCPVEYEEDTYFIKFEDLDINVWGSSREEVEEAFVFSFYSLYKIYYLESDENLSEKAILLKKKLHKLIKNVNSKELQS